MGISQSLNELSVKATDSTWCVAEFMLIFVFYILVTHQGQPSSLRVKKMSAPNNTATEA